MEKTNSIINSLKRLERVGEETSVVTQKLKDSCEEVATKILRICMDTLELEQDTNEKSFSSISLPEGIDYVIRFHNDNKYIMISGDYEHFGFKHFTLDEYVSRENALKFSKMIADGWLDKFADFIEARKARDLKAIESFKNNK